MASRLWSRRSSSSDSTVSSILHGQRAAAKTAGRACSNRSASPYTGSDVLGSALSMDKIRTKQVWVALELPTPRYARLAPNDDVRAAARSLGLPVIVKPASEGSSVGVSRVLTEAELPDAVALARRYPGELLMEQLIDGDELTVGVLGDEALPSIRIVPAGAYYDYSRQMRAETTQISALTGGGAPCAPSRLRAGRLGSVDDARPTGANLPR